MLGFTAGRNGGVAVFVSGGAGATALGCRGGYGRQQFIMDNLNDD
jgi:hypothetical protein